MSNLRPRAKLAALGLIVFALLAQRHATAQVIGRQPLKFEISGPNERLEMIINTSRILTTERNIPKLLVDNETIVRAQPIAPNQVQIVALKTGFTTLTVWDEAENEHAIDVLVYGDSRELENLLMTEFPDASLRVRPLQSSVVVTGYVPRAEMVSQIVQIAEDYYPSVVNNISLGGVQQVLLHVQVMEVSRTKLRKLGFDWSLFTGNDAVIQNAAGLVADYSIVPGMNEVLSMHGESIVGTVVDGSNAFFGFLETLRQYDLVKVLAEPTLVTVSGRPASFSSGGEFPILVPQSLGTVSVEYRQFGTRVDFVPIVLGNGRVRLEIRPEVSEIDPARSVTINNTTVPGLRLRWADTAVEMNTGQTLALAGLIQTQVEAQNKGLPWLSDLPWVGGVFRRVQEQQNEIELLILVTPEFVSALEPHQIPPCGPGQLTTSPKDVDLFWRGYLEVPKSCLTGNCVNCPPGGHGPANGSGFPQGTQQGQPAPVVAPAAEANRRSPVRPAARRGPPTLIGPIGYDDLQ